MTSLDVDKRRLEERYRSLFDQNPDGVYSLDRRGRLVETNPAMEALTGYSVEELTGRNPVRIVAPQDRRWAADRFSEALRGEARCHETTIVRKDGRRVDLHITQVPIVVGGEVVGVYGVAKDITERKRAERKLVDSERRLSALLANAPILLYRCLNEPGWPGEFVSDYAWEITGYSPGELTDGTVLFGDLIVEEDRERVWDEVQAALAGRRRFHLRYSIRRRDGALRKVEEYGQGAYGEHGEVLTVEGAIRDVTDRGRTEEELRTSEAEMRALFKAMDDVIFVLDAEGRCLKVASTNPSLLHRRPDELPGRTLHEVLPKEQADMLRAGVRHALETRQKREVEYSLRIGGREIWFEGTISPMAEDRVLFIARDVTGRRGAEGKLLEAEALYRTLVEQIPAVTYVDRAHGSFEPIYTSPQIEAMLGYTPEEWRTEELWGKRLHPDDRERILAADDRFEAGGESFSEEYRLLARDGRVVWVREEAVVVRDEAGEPLFWQGVIFDITGRREAEKALRKSEASLAEAQRIAHLGSWEWDHGTEETYWSDETFRIHGFAPREFVPTFEKFVERVHPDDRSMVKEMLRAALHEGERYDLEHQVVRPGGEERVVHCRAEVIRDERGEPLRMVGSIHDVTERKALERRLELQALHDPLTGLPNRTLFIDRLGHALARAGRRDGSVAVIFLDLDNFKNVNDSLGHEAGDRLLVAVAGRLRALLRPEDTLARLGGDEFVALLENVKDRKQAIRVVERVGKGMRVPIFVNEREIFTTASIGVTFSDSADERPEDLIRDADAAMYRAKWAGKDHHAVFRPEMKRSSLRRLGLEGDLRRALRSPGAEFRVHYQPKALFGTRHVVGAEALLRWEHPHRGMVLPAEFMPLAEETGLIVPLGGWALEESCRQAKRWRTEHPTEHHLSINVNLSARQFRDPDLVARVEKVLKETELPPGDLCLEISENVLMEDTPSAMATLTGLKDLGVRLAVDDFGTSYSSLSHLKRSSVDTIKVDHSIVSGLDGDVGDADIVSAMITLAHALGLEVVAEGVETETEARELRSLGCDVAQGYYFWKPVSAEEMADIMVGNAREDHGRADP